MNIGEVSGSIWSQPPLRIGMKEEIEEEMRPMDPPQSTQEDVVGWMQATQTTTTFQWGIEVVGDVKDRRGNRLLWEDRKQTSLPESLQAPYDKLLENRDLNKGGSYSTPSHQRSMLHRVPSRMTPLSGDTI